MKYTRKQNIASELWPKRALIIYGPRRVGKTTLLKDYLVQEGKTTPPDKVFYGIGEDIKLRELYQSEDRSRLINFATPYDIIAIDEAQYTPSIGLGTKMIIDALPEKKIVLTGSSSFDLSGQIGEPLTGRHFTLTLLPIAQSEMLAGKFELTNALHDYLVFGSYPEILNAGDSSTRIKLLNELVSSYLFKDVLILEKIKSPNLLRDIAACLAFQLGNEVSMNEIAVAVTSDVKTVARYLDLLEKMFVIKRVRGFSRNLRNEIVKKAKYYFLDNGVRNAVISQFNPLHLRNDIGALWENFIFMELFKKSNIEGRFDNFYFWRTHAGQEIDIIRERNGVLEPIECKWSGGQGAKLPKVWQEAYGNTPLTVVTKENYLDILLKPS
ncbi:MAG TPA: ATP-binding protein [Candidatus Paceibacterota bacterium]